MNDRELQLAKQAAARLLRDRAPGLTESDRHLLRKYPKHSLEEAREIEATGPKMPAPQWPEMTTEQIEYAQERLKQDELARGIIQHNTPAQPPRGSGN